MEKLFPTFHFLKSNKTHIFWITLFTLQMISKVPITLFSSWLKRILAKISATESCQKMTLAFIFKMAIIKSFLIFWRTSLICFWKEPMQVANQYLSLPFRTKIALTLGFGNLLALKVPFKHWTRLPIFRYLWFTRLHYKCKSPIINQSWVPQGSAPSPVL